MEEKYAFASAESFGTSFSSLERQNNPARDIRDELSCELVRAFYFDCIS